ncbi:MAG: hypothetical protein HZB33_07345 [Nitrospirae bacterium]|nr:hypothetical protein [Nitrospirota bacterium]
MGITAAKKYITELHKKQDNPYLWPDFLTGLPDKAAIIKRLGEVYPRLGRYAIAYVRIANIHPYLIKYGPDRHAEIIQWAAAILKTTCETCNCCFVATVSTHDFIVICESHEMRKHIRGVIDLFNKKIGSFYSSDDRTKKSVISFVRDGEKVDIGLIKMVAVILNSRPAIEKNILIREMGKACERLEGSSDDILIFEGAEAS